MPTVALQLFNPDTVCITAGSFALTGGSPASGTYSGNGVSDGTFTPSIAGAGTYTVAYSYSNVNGYADSASQTIFVDVCVGISHYSLLKSLFIPIRTLVSSLSLMEICKKPMDEQKKILDETIKESATYFILITNQKHIIRNS